MSKYRVRYANNVITLYEYEKPVKNYYHTFRSQLIERLNKLKYNYDWLDFRKLNTYLYEKENNVVLEKLNDTELVNFLNFFEKELQHQISIFDSEVANKDKLKVLNANMQAKKDRMIDTINANLVGNCFFITLTYDNDNVLFKADLKESNANFTRFIRSLNNYLYGKNEKGTVIRDLKYFARWELQTENDRNAIHYHMIVFDFEQSRFTKQQLNDMRDLWGLGSFNVKKIVKKTSGVGKYISKYLGKDLDDYVSGAKSYFSSRNLKRPFNDFVKVFDYENNVLILESGVVVNLNEYNIEKIEEFETFFNGKTKKITYNKE